MFCPKCGSNLPDGASFCSKCGNQMGVPAAKPGRAVLTSNNVEGGSAKHTSATTDVAPVWISATIAIVLALIFGLLPWMESSSTLLGMGAIGSGIGNIVNPLMGSSSSFANFESSYSPFGFFGLANALNHYPGGSSASGIFRGFFFGWLVCFVLAVVSLVFAITTRKNPKAPRVCLFLVPLPIFALFYTYAYQGIVQGGMAVGTPTNAIYCGVLCLVAIVLAIIGSRQAAAKRA